MQTAFNHAAVALLLASTALCQVTIPPHASIYNGYSRGFNFTANTNFIITQLDLPVDAFQAGDTAGYLVRINGNVALYSTGNAGAVSASLLVNTGDVVDVIGNWSPAAPGSFTAHNSYGSGAPYSTVIEGVPHTLNRTGWQWDIGDPLYTSGSYLAPTSGSLGRVLMYTSPPSGLFPNFTATPTSGASPLSVQFTDATFSSDPGGVVGWQWDFDGDSIIDSTVQNPSFTYTACGSYSVSLTAIDATHGPVTVTKPNFITTDVISADFTYAVIAPNTVQFTDLSAPAATTWAWDFDNDSVIDSTVQNPVFVYPANSTITPVTLTASRLCGPPDTVVKNVLPATAIATTQVGGNGLSGTGAGNVFDIQVTNPLGINVTSIDVTPWATAAGPVTCDIYLTDDTSGYASNHSTQSLWRLVATGSGNAQISTSSAPVSINMTLNQRFYIAPGSYSMAIHMNGSGIVYTTGNGTNQVYSNADVTLTLGLGKGAPFATGANNPRVWNGVLYYDLCNLGGLAGYGFFGAGCPGTSGVTNLDATSLPILGQTLTVQANNLPQNAGVMLLGFSRTTSVFGPLPLNLAIVGAPGCFGRVSTEGQFLLIGAGNQATFNVPIPNIAALMCLPFYNQMLVFDPAANGLGAVASDAAAGIIGN